MTAFPALAQVRFRERPQPFYISQAWNHQGFIVQRRYRGVGEPEYRQGEYDAYGRPVENYREVEAFLQPFLNPWAVDAAGLNFAAIMRWSAANPGEIFTHPTYASLCLRWGTHVHGVQVEEVACKPFAPDDVLFTPHTCWNTGEVVQLRWTV